MSIRGKTIGLMQVGLSSEEAPVVTPLTAQSILPVGLTIIGTNSGVPSSSIFMCKGKLRVSSRTLFSSTGFIHIPYYTTSTVVGYFFSRHNDHPFRVSGDLSVPGDTAIKTSGVIRQQSLVHIKAIGISGYPNITMAKVSAICKANYRAISRIIGVIEREQLNPIRVTAVCKANYLKAVKTIGLLVYENKAYFKITGVSATLAQSFVAVTGILGQLSITPFKIIGALANTIEHNFIRITGVVNIAAFVSSVPKKVQEFVTNKKWWR